MLSPYPPFICSFDPLDCVLLCSPISNISLDIHEDQVLDGVGVLQETCDILYDDYVLESTSKQESAMKDDFPPSVPLPHYPDIFCNFIIPIESCEKLVSDDIITSNHFQNSWNVSFSSECGEKKSSLLNFPTLSSHHSKNLEGEISCFPSSLLYDSLNHEDASIFVLELYNHGCHDLFTHSSNHDSDFFSLNFSKPPVFHDLPSNDLELSQAVKALQPKIMVM